MNRDKEYKSLIKDSVIKPIVLENHTHAYHLYVVRVKNRDGLPPCKPRRFAFPNQKTQPYGQANRIVKKLLNYNIDFIES